MKTFIMFLTTIILGLGYGYFLSHYTRVPEIIGSTLIFGWLFVFAISVYKYNNTQHER